MGTGTAMGSGTAVGLNRINENSGALSKQIWTMRQGGPGLSFQRETGSSSLSGGMWLSLPRRKCSVQTYLSLNFSQTPSELLVPIYSSSSTGLLTNLFYDLHHQGCLHAYSMISTIRAVYILTK